jgi:hypothetical protein
MGRYLRKPGISRYLGGGIVGEVLDTRPGWDIRPTDYSYNSSPQWGGLWDDDDLTYGWANASTSWMGQAFPWGVIVTGVYIKPFDSNNVITQIKVVAANHTELSDPSYDSGPINGVQVADGLMYFKIPIQDQATIGMYNWGVLPLSGSGNYRSSKMQFEMHRAPTADDIAYGTNYLIPTALSIVNSHHGTPTITTPQLFVDQPEPVKMPMAIQNIIYLAAKQLDEQRTHFTCLSLFVFSVLAPCYIFIRIIERTC